MPREIHKHTWEKVHWTKPDLLPDTAKKIGLTASRYASIHWNKGEICEDCNAVILRTRDNSTILTALENHFLPFRERPEGPVVGVLVDFEQITDKLERAFR